MQSSKATTSCDHHSVGKSDIATTTLCPQRVCSPPRAGTLVTVSHPPDCQNPPKVLANLLGTLNQLNGPTGTTAYSSTQCHQYGHHTRLHTDTQPLFCHPQGFTSASNILPASERQAASVLLNHNATLRALQHRWPTSALHTQADAWAGVPHSKPQLPARTTYTHTYAHGVRESDVK